ncbi:uncharacterized protein MYCFIDRAFT_200553 [Pseudocercospora fijiensis CIRAD86]|uniref:F-box domain-containing protein n=1 Tax=Pseudocercospora fijiensis (strain CIRAD86) TaxID=383855 RepID=M3AJ68_PSEFD|nr:uncharacterized protein MYCFIDRAFT_200553 [Pseudocercospora fijiensis CIRAD86]EME77223.1 hypothetical protein MYCFIDRAFT_200553 [Pseudocercospora fijiensis CIRAD86]
MALRHLFDLPTETKLIILSHLPFKEIQRTRATSRHIRDLIDYEQNRTVLLQSTAPIQVLAISEAYDNVFRIDPHKTDLLGFVNYFFQQRQHAHHTGTQEERRASPLRTCDIIARLWVRRAAVFSKHIVRSDIRDLIYELVQLHTFHAGTKKAFVDWLLKVQHFATAALTDLLNYLNGTTSSLILLVLT